MKFIAFLSVLLCATISLAQTPPIPVPQPQPPQPQLSCEQLEANLEAVSDALLEMTNESTKWHGAKHLWYTTLQKAVGQQNYFLALGEPVPQGVTDTINQCRANLKIIDAELKAIRERQAYLTAVWSQVYSQWIEAGCN